MNSTTTFYTHYAFFFPHKPKDNSLVRERKLLQKPQRLLMKNSSEALEQNNFTSCPSISNRETTKLLERISSVVHFISQSTCSMTYDQKISGQNQTLGFDCSF